MRFPRACGILLHPSSLPSPYGIGELGKEAFDFADFLIASGQRYWQILPLGPTGYGDSPYQSFSAFAGNPLLISLDKLADEGLLNRDTLTKCPAFPVDKVDYGPVIAWKRAALEEAFACFESGATAAQREAFERFLRDDAPWLPDYALYTVLKEVHNHKPWTQWPSELALRQPDAIAAARWGYSRQINMVSFIQYIFFKQWWELRHYCYTKGLRIIGDIPIYAAHDSADVWANPHLFQLKEDGSPIVVGGVPPDYFCDTGQLWGNPLYRWDYMASMGYAWWIERLRFTFRLVDIVRIDHFRGFEAYWEIPGDAETAVGGRWVDGPRDGLFHAFRNALGWDLPIIAENLGLITPEVEALRERFALPGMAVLQFGFGEDAATSGLPPHAYVRDLAAYTGTHDNDTTKSWWDGLEAQNPKQKAYIQEYLQLPASDVTWACIRTIMASVADTAIVPMQDVLDLGGDARMNQPGFPSGNWQWRLLSGQTTKTLAARLYQMAEVYDRLPEKPAVDKKTTE